MQPWLRDEVAKGDGSEEMMLEYEKSKVIMDMMDRIIAVMHEEKGEVDGVLVSAMPSVSSEDLPSVTVEDVMPSVTKDE